MRAVVVLVLGTFLAAGAGYWPVAFWHDYAKATPLELPGARFVRLDPATVKEYRRLTAIVEKNCDTFYSAPAFDSLYIFTRVPPITGLLANGPGVLDEKEQREVVQQLADAGAIGKRVCIVRNDDSLHDWLASSYGEGPLGKMLVFFQHKVGQAGHYSVSLPGPPAPSAHE